MHESHKRALNAVRKRFRAARNDLNLRINAYEVAKHRNMEIRLTFDAGSVHAAYVQREQFEIHRQRRLAIIKHYRLALMDAIERYQEAGDILVTVERLLEKA